ncbi:MAG: HAMP domain-containing sensor histidine kinase, partial [Caldimonas sp.]
MSHELRTPLNPILGFSQLLQGQAAERLSETEVGQLQHIQHAGWHLLSLADDVLDVSRIEGGNLGVDRRSLPLAPVLEMALRISEPAAAKRAVALRASYNDAARVNVLADPVRLRQVMINLLSNAIKYNRPGGSVDVSVAVGNERVEIEITDTGLGMSPEQLEHLYEPFNRLGRDHEGIEGTGIGMTLSRELVR